MLKPKRRRPHQNGNGPGVAPEAAPVGLPPGATLLTVPLQERPVRMAPTGKLRLDPPSDPAQTMILILDAPAGLWKAILLPPGSRWVLQAEAAPKPGLWTPPGSLT